MTRRVTAGTLWGMAKENRTGKKRNGEATQFSGKPGPGRPKGVGNKGPLVPQQLKDMRYVYKTEKAGGEHPNDTSGQSICRKLCRENPQQFLAQLSRLEQQHRENLEKWKAVQREKKDKPLVEKSELVVLMDRLLDEWEDENG